jgi:hypothetical protein
VEVHGLATAWDWLIGSAYAIFCYVVVLRMRLIGVFQNINTRYPFDDTEMARFNRLYGRPVAGGG